MSYILDAIRKSESDRRRGQVPGVLAVQSVPTPAPSRASRWLVFAPMAVVVGVAVAGAIWWMQETPPPRAVADASEAAAVAPSANRGGKASDTTVADALPPAGLRRGGETASLPPTPPLTAPPVIVSPPPGTAWALTPVPMVATPPAGAARGTSGAWAGDPGESGLTDDEIAVLLEGEGVPLNAPPQRREQPRPSVNGDRPAAKAAQKHEPAWYASARADLATIAAEQRSGGTAAVPPPRSNEPSAALVSPRSASSGSAKSRSAAVPSAPAIGDLPASIRAQVPPIALSIHMFADDPAARRVRINDQSLHEGDPVSPDLQVAAITRDGVVFRFKGNAFFLSANDNWQPR